MSNNPYRELNIGPFRKIYYKHLVPGKLRVHKLFGKKLFYTNSTELLHGLTEIFVDQNYKQRLSSNPYILDCGANIGLSVIYLKRLFPKAEIVAFEPDGKNFEILKKNVESFGLTGVDLRKEAVWVRDGPVSFSAQGSMDSRIDSQSNGSSGSVTGIRLRRYMDRDVDFLKMDIEGAEYEVLKDIGDNLRNAKNIFIEYHGLFEQNGELVDMLQLFSQNGFSYYIKEAYPIFKYPFCGGKDSKVPFDIQLNIFAFRH